MISAGGVTVRAVFLCIAVCLLQLVRFARISNLAVSRALGIPLTQSALPAPRPASSANPSAAR